MTNDRNPTIPAARRKSKPPASFSVLSRLAAAVGLAIDPPKVRRI
jgi:hypothetical protein